MTQGSRRRRSKRGAGDAGGSSKQQSNKRKLRDRGKEKVVLEKDDEETIDEVGDSDYDNSESEYLQSDSSTDDNSDYSSLKKYVKERKQTVGTGKRRKEKLYEKEGEKEGGENEKEETGVALGDEGEAGVVHNNQSRNWEKKKKKGRKKKDKPLLQWEIWEKENEEWLDENENSDVDLDCVDEIVEIAKPPSDLLMPLLRYQKEWLAWALKQEESASKGGILADEMGMGKTIQAIALVLAKREMSRMGYEVGGPSSSAASSSIELPELRGTLVICPVVAVMQWVNEVTKYTQEKSTKVLVYHGPNRTKEHTQLFNYDFVLTTYSIVEAEYRKNVMPPKEKCVWCGKHFYPKKMKVHLRYFCGPDAIRTEKQSKQVRKKGKHKLTSFDSQSTIQKVADGKNVKQAQKVKDFGSSSSKGNPLNDEQSSLVKNSILHSVKWNRIILDEAHVIKERRSNTAKAVLALKSSYKWALSGTPLQNRVGELYSLVRFLQITPYSYYFCKDCDCKVLDFCSSMECPNCPHKSMRHFCWWNRYFATPIQTYGNSCSGRRAMILLKHKLLKSILLRRTKKGRAADLALPPRIITLRRDSLDLKEEDCYESLYNESQLQFNTYVESGNLMNNYAHIFDLLTRLRQAVDHPYLVIYSNASTSKNDGHTNNDEQNRHTNNDEQECGICHDPPEDAVVTSCDHVFCKDCLIDYAAALGQVSCPSCSKPLTADFTTKINPRDLSSKTTIKGFRSSSILNKINLENFQTSTKIEALDGDLRGKCELYLDREEIRFMVERDGSAKGIVFSQFTSFLDLIRYSLEKSSIQCAQLVGSMSMAARDAAIRKFTDDPDCKIFLVSLKAGGVALNLTVASHVFVMDPWWNPAVERQAQDRIHRIGQYKPIRIVRFIIENTIEERILKLQQKKELVFEGTVGGSNEALVKLTEADLRFLFAN